jgi:hypothetical protein
MDPAPDNSTRNIIIGVVVALIVVLLGVAIYAGTRPSISLSPAPSGSAPAVTATPAAEETTTAEPTPSKEAPTPKPTKVQPTAQETPTEVAVVPTEPAGDLASTELWIAQRGHRPDYAGPARRSGLWH